jgi:hypothetical protein
MTLPGKTKRITVEPVKAPAIPAKEPVPTEAPQKVPEKVPA